jgi:hypothetical protein
MVSAPSCLVRRAAELKTLFIGLNRFAVSSDFAGLMFFGWVLLEAAARGRSFVRQPGCETMR